MEAFLSFFPVYVHSGTKGLTQAQGPKAEGRVTAPLTASLSLFPLDKREVGKVTWYLRVLCCS